MKKFALILTVLATISSAHATSTIRTVASCTLDRMMMDTYLQVTVSQYTGPATIGHSPYLTATVEQGFLGRTQKTSFDGLKEVLPQPGNLGGGTSFTGKDFNLDLCTDCAQVNGKIPATLTYELDGQRNVEQVACELNR